MQSAPITWPVSVLADSCKTCIRHRINTKAEITITTRSHQETIRTIEKILEAIVTAMYSQLPEAAMIPFIKAHRRTCRRFLVRRVRIPNHLHTRLAITTNMSTKSISLVTTTVLAQMERLPMLRA